jgi:ferredoxin-type protein NapF
METIVTRRGFLRGRLRSAGNHVRPPWAHGIASFELACDRCGACIEACPAGILKPGDGGFPRVDFALGECTFCAECVHACKPGALKISGDAPPWRLRACIGQDCLADRGVECRICGEACGTGAIRFRPRLGGVARPELDSERCTGCGACHAPCPVGAIAMETHQ